MLLLTQLMLLTLLLMLQLMLLTLLLLLQLTLLTQLLMLLTLLLTLLALRLTLLQMLLLLLLKSTSRFTQLDLKGRPSGRPFCLLMHRVYMSNEIIPELPDLLFDENSIPISQQFADSYYSKSGGYEETYAVFLKACGLPDAWKGSDNFVIAELGFGTGLNFLCTWEMWNATRPEPGTLHYVSFEQFPMQVEDSTKALEKWPLLAKLSKQLLNKWPKRLNGHQRIWFAEDRICLTLVIGDAAETLGQQDFKADAWYLDGFSPKNNPELWSEEVLKEVHRLSKPVVKIATYSVAKIVRDNLSAVGLDYKKCEGFGHKRERLEAWIEGEADAAHPKKPKSALIIGGGIAGCACAFALSRRDIDCTIIDNDENGAIKASNNLAGLIMPRLDRLNTNEAKFFRAAYLDALCVLGELEENCFKQTGVIEHPRSERDKEKFNQFKTNAPLPPEMLGFANDNLHHFDGGIVYPAKILATMGSKAIKIHAHIAKIETDDAGKSRALAHDGNVIATADICIIANGQGIGAFIDAQEYAVEGRAGVVSFAKANWPDNQVPIGGKSYCLPFDDGVLFGATFVPQKLEAPAKIELDSHDRNLELLREFSPNMAAEIESENVTGRASMRVVTKDRLPIAGTVPGKDGLYMLGALGSRGFSTASICAEVIASMACADPMPLERDLLALISPMRFDKHRAQSPQVESL